MNRVATVRPITKELLNEISNGGGWNTQYVEDLKNLEGLKVIVGGFRAGSRASRGLYKELQLPVPARQVKSFGLYHGFLKLTTIKPPKISEVIVRNGEFI